MRTVVAVVGALATVALTSAIAFALAVPQAAPAAAAVRALADCAAVATLGLAIVPIFDDGRRRTELAALAERPLVAVSAAWLVTELVRLLLGTAETAAVAPWRLPVRSVLDYSLHTVGGRADLVSLCAAGLACVVAAVARRPHGPALAGVAAVGIAARVVSGHLSQNSVGAVAVAVHALAAALWCGGLVALTVTITHRGQWARVLPRFSQLSVVCVAVLLASGAVSGVLAAGSPAHWYASGYGRLLVAKVLLAVVLVVVGWRNRTVWLPAARAHRASADLSGNRSTAEVVLMISALTAAAALAVTG
jgi:putative copper resistance protein D